MCFSITGSPIAVKLFQAWTVIKGKAYIVTFSSPESTHEQYREVVDGILDSLQFTTKLQPHQKPIESLCMVYYENEKHGFRVRHPRSWQAVQPQSGALCSLNMTIKASN
jgi:hypothetical protein